MEKNYADSNSNCKTLCVNRRRSQTLTPDSIRHVDNLNVNGLMLYINIQT